jgi:glutamate 5-kinase
VLASGKEADVLPRIVSGEALGTHFPAQGTLPENRKRWILAGAVSTGRIIVDEGAAHALLREGRSLLPAGIAAVEGMFERGDTVSIVGENSREVALGEIARGIARYSSVELDRIKSWHSDEIPNILGYTYGAVAVHRNDMILL